jgi:uncharacterized delta-60 repeat protein
MMTGTRWQDFVGSNSAAIFLSFWLVPLLSGLGQQPGDVDRSFDPGPSVYAVYALAMQPDGKCVIGGSFSTVSGGLRAGMARLDAEGNADPTFGQGLAGADSQIDCVAIQEDGKILIGGRFSAVNGVARGRIARLNSDGTVDTAFGNGLAGADNYVCAVAVQRDGRILIGGYFKKINGVPCEGFARVNADGTLDPAFASISAFSFISSIAVQSDDKILVGGVATVNGVPVSNAIARLNPDGTPDSAFNGQSEAHGFATAIAVQGDGKIVLAGFFRAANGATLPLVIRLNADGTLDSNFANGLVGPDDDVSAVALDNDGRIFLGGFFTHVHGVVCNRVARLNPDGTLDSTFATGLVLADDRVYCLGVQMDGKPVFGGWFGAVNGTARDRLARLNCDGALDPAFGNHRSGLDDYVSSMAVQNDGKIVIGGVFTHVAGAVRNYVARLNLDGSLDITFGDGPAGPNGDIRSVATQSDGKVIIGGNFTAINGIAKYYLARLNADGALDSTFGNGLAGPNKMVVQVAVQSDGKILLAGRFTTVNKVGQTSIARLKSDGSLDSTFANSLTGSNNFIYALALQSDGKILLGGSFLTISGPGYKSIARLEADGTLDSGFGAGQASPYSTVNALAPQPDGKTVIGGSFTTINGVTQVGIARLNADGTVDNSFSANLGDSKNFAVQALAVQTDGKILAGGFFTNLNGVAVDGFARLNADGTLDSAFVASVQGPLCDRPFVTALALQNDGRILLAGDFAGVDWQPRRYLARLWDRVPAGHLTLTRLPDRTVQVAADSPYSLPFRIEGSTDLMEWQTLTNLPKSPATIEWRDPDALNSPHRYYRGVWTP